MDVEVADDNEEALPRSQRGPGLEALPLNGNLPSILAVESVVVHNHHDKMGRLAGEKSHKMDSPGYHTSAVER